MTEEKKIGKELSIRSSGIEGRLSMPTSNTNQQTCPPQSSSSRLRARDINQTPTYSTPIVDNTPQIELNSFFEKFEKTVCENQPFDNSVNKASAQRRVGNTDNTSKDEPKQTDPVSEEEANVSHFLAAVNDFSEPMVDEDDKKKALMGYSFNSKKVG